MTAETMPLTSTAAEHGGHHDEQQIVPGVERGNANQQSEDQVDQTFAGDLIVQRIADAAGHHAACKVRNGQDCNYPRQQQSRGGEDGSGECISSLSRGSGEQRRGKGQRKSEEAIKNRTQAPRSTLRIASSNCWRKLMGSIMTSTAERRHEEPDGWKSLRTPGSRSTQRLNSSGASS